MRGSCPASVTGAPQPAYEDTAARVGEGVYLVTDEAALAYGGTWDTVVVPADELGTDKDVAYANTSESGARYDLAFNGQKVEVTYRTGPDHGIWVVEMDGQPLLDEGTGDPIAVRCLQPDCSLRGAPDIPGDCARRAHAQPDQLWRQGS